MIQSVTNVTLGKSVFKIIRKKFPTIFLLFSLHETDWATVGLFICIYPLSAAEPFPELESIIKLPVKLQTLWWSVCGPLIMWPIRKSLHGPRQKLISSARNMCLWAYFEGENKKKNFMKLVHWAFMICSLSANGKTPTGPLSSHITHKNTYICTGSCHTVSGVCQRFASAQTSQVFEQTGSFRFSVVRRQ